MQEVIISASGPLLASNGLGVVTVYDINTGTSLLGFKQTTGRTVAISTRDGQGGLILAAQSEKALIHAYSYQKDQLHLRIVLPEKLTCLAVNSTGNYCAGGTQTGRIYLWEAASGILFNSFDAHYRRVNVIKFTPDGAALITASEDSGVSVWSVPRLLDSLSQNEVPTPYWTMSDHTLPITDFVIGVGSFPNCRVLTSSLDNSCKLWDLASRTLISTFLFPQPIGKVALDSTERTFFATSVATTENGEIYQVNLFRRRGDKLHSSSVEAVGGGGAENAERIAKEEAAEKRRLIHVGQPITALTISLTTSLLLVGTRTGFIHLYDIASHQLVRSIPAPNNHKDYTIIDLYTTLKPTDLMGHSNLGSSSSKDEAVPIRSIAPFQRTRDPKTRDAHEVSVLPPAQHDTFVPRAPGPSKTTLAADHLFYLSPTSSTTFPTPAPLVASAPQSTAASDARLAELEAQVAALTEQLARAKGLNDALWEGTVSAVLAEKGDLASTEKGPKGNAASTQPVEAKSNDGEGRARKRKKKN